MRLRLRSGTDHPDDEPDDEHEQRHGQGEAVLGEQLHERVVHGGDARRPTGILLEQRLESAAADTDPRLGGPHAQPRLDEGQTQLVGAGRGLGVGGQQHDERVDAAHPGQHERGDDQRRDDAGGEPGPPSHARAGL